MAGSAVNVITTPFGLIDVVDGSLDSVYGKLFGALRESAFQAAPIMIALWLIYVGVSLVAGKAKKPGEYFYQLFIIGFFFSLAIYGDVTLALALPIFTDAPYELGAEMLGETGSSTLDLFKAFFSQITGFLTEQWQSTKWRNWGKMLLLSIVGWGSLILISVMVIFLILLSKIAIALLVAIMPIFLLFSMFDATRNIAVAYLQQLINYAMVPLLVSGVLFLNAAVFKTLGKSYLAPPVDEGIGFLIGFGIINGVLFLIIKQIPMMAAGIAGGVVLTGGGGYSLIRKAASAAAGFFARNIYDRMPRSFKNFMGSISSRASKRNDLIASRSPAKKRRKQATESNLSPNDANQTVLQSLAGGEA